MISLRETTSSQ